MNIVFKERNLSVRTESLYVRGRLFVRGGIPVISYTRFHDSCELTRLNRLTRLLCPSPTPGQFPWPPPKGLFHRNSSLHSFRTHKSSTDSHLSMSSASSVVPLYCHTVYLPRVPLTHEVVDVSSYVLLLKLFILVFPSIKLSYNLTCNPLRHSFRLTPVHSFILCPDGYVHWWSTSCYKLQ